MSLSRRAAAAGLALAVSAGAGASAPSRFCRLTSDRWALGARWVRRNLRPVPNPHPSPEPQPRRAKPYDVVVSADGTKVYVTLQGSELEPGSEVAVVDVRGRTVARRIRLAGRGADDPAASSPFRLALHPGGRFLVVTSRFSNFASVIDTRRDEVVTEIPLDFYGQGMAFSADGRTLYVANRYLDQVFVVDVEVKGGRFRAAMRELGGLSESAFAGGVHPALRARCGTAGCHDRPRGGFEAGHDARASFASAIPFVRPGDAMESPLARAGISATLGGDAGRLPPFEGHAGGIVFADPPSDPDYRALVRWIDAAADGPGVAVGNPRSKPKVCAMSADGRLLFVGNTGTQDVSVVDLAAGRDIGGIFIQNVVNDLKTYRSPRTGRELLLVTTLGVGFGVARERDPFGGESSDRSNPAAQYTVRRDLATGRTLPRADQQLLGAFDAVDGTAAIKFRDVQNDLVVVDVGALAAGARDGEGRPPGWLLLPNRYESHPAWTRYTSDTAESAAGDMKGDIPPDLMRVVGSFPEKMALAGDRLFVTMQGSAQVQEWRIDAEAADPSDVLAPIRTYPTGLQPIGIASGPPGTPAAGLVFTANFLAGTLSVIDACAGTSREVLLDPSAGRLPFPATNAERGEVVAHTALFSSDGDTSCFHCHYFDMGDGRPWGVSQVVGQEYLAPHDEAGQLVIGGTMGVPQMRGLFAIQPFFYEGTLSAFEPRSMIMEHCPADDFALPGPQGDFTSIVADRPSPGTNDVQSKMDASSGFEADLEERRDEFVRRTAMRWFGKAYRLRDLVRFVGDWQIAQPRLLPNPFDRDAPSVGRGRALFESAQVGCATCHPAPAFARKDFPDNPTQSMPPVVTATARDASFTLIGMNRLDAINGVRRDLEPWDPGREEEHQAHYTPGQLRGLWDRPPVFLHNGMARTPREIVCPPGHRALRRAFRREPLIAGVPERPGRREAGFNGTWSAARPPVSAAAHLAAGGRLGTDTHGGTTQLSAREIDDLVDYLESIE